MKLKRDIGLTALIIYGVGDILGAGIYGLIGKAAGEMGNAVWLAFLASMVAAGLTGLSYAGLGSRHSKAGGAAFFTYRAFGSPFLAYAVGLAALASGITSMAAASRAFAGYFIALVGGPSTEVVIVGFCLLIAGIVLRGIRESMWANVVLTAVEFSGLLLVLAVGARYLGSVNYLDTVTPLNPSGDLSFALVLSGAVLTFYSFVGFEDIINVAEEVKEPKRNLPRGIVVAVSIASVIYIGISLVAVSVIPSSELSKSSAPLMDVMAKAAPWFPRLGFTFIALFAVANTALLNFIMGSRLAYGMANDGLLPRVLARVSPNRHTPHIASFAILALLLILVFAGDIAALARATSVLLLCCFIVVNISLVVLKLRRNEPRGEFEVPIAVPALGALVCVTMLAASRAPELRLAGAIFIGIAVLYFVMRARAMVSAHSH